MYSSYIWAVILELIQEECIYAAATIYGITRYLARVFPIPYSCKRTYDMRLYTYELVHSIFVQLLSEDLSCHS